MAAGIVAVFATAITFAIATGVLSWKPTQVLWAIGVSNLAACCCLPITLVGERVPWFKKHVIPDQTRTWAFFIVIYFAVFFGLIEEVRELRAFFWMVLPLILTTGFMIWTYGPVHDFFVRRTQLRRRRKAGA